MSSQLLIIAAVALAAAAAAAASGGPPRPRVPLPRAAPPSLPLRSAAARAAAAASGAPEQVHLMHIGVTDTDTDADDCVNDNISNNKVGMRMAVSWATMLPSVPVPPSVPEAEVRVKMMGRSTTAAARVFTYAEDLGGFNGWLCEAVIDGLAPGRPFSYSVAVRATEGHAWVASEWFNATAFPPVAGPGAADPFSVLWVADMGLDESGWTLDGLKADAATGKYAALMHSGDISYANDRTHVGIQNAYVWNDYMEHMSPVTSRIPWQVGVGNHERQWNFEVYEKRFPLALAANASGSTSPLWYSYDMGSLVHFTAWSSESDFKPGSEQYKWLEKDLRDARARKIPFLVVYDHRALYCTGLIDTYVTDRCGPLPKGEAGQYRAWLEPLFHEVGVDLAVEGHNHQYERSYPVYQQKVNMTHGTTYIVNGAAGNIEQLDPTFIFPGPEWRAECRPLEYGYGRLHATPDTLTWEFVDANFGDQRVSDSVVIKRRDLLQQKGRQH